MLMAGWGGAVKEPGLRCHKTWILSEKISPFRRVLPRRETFPHPRTLFAGRGGHFMSDTVTTPALGKHGATILPAVEVDSYNLELKDDEGFLGDRASRQAFHAILENWRKPLRKIGADPFGDKASDDLNRSKLDLVLK